jgi:hypothetical protein
MLKNLLAISILVLLICVAGAAAQNKWKCSVEVQAEESGGGHVGGAAATAVNLSTGKKYTSGLFEGYPEFSKLPTGRYTFTVKARGYQAGIKQYHLICPRPSEDDTYGTREVAVRLRKIRRGK